MIRCSVPSAPNHLHSSKALAPLPLPLGYRGKLSPGVLNFARAGMYTPPKNFSPKEGLPPEVFWESTSFVKLLH